MGEEEEEEDEWERRVGLGSHVRYDLLSEDDQREWRKRRTDAINAHQRSAGRQLRLTEATKTLQKEVVATAKEQKVLQKELTLLLQHHRRRRELGPDSPFLLLLAL